MVDKKYKSFQDFLEEEFPDYIVRGDEKISVIRTGSLALDISLGIGGIPLNRFTMIYGPESSGKTTLCLSLCKHALMDGYRVLYIDQELGLDYPYIRTVIGESFDPDKFTLVQPNTAEEALEIAEKGIRFKEQQLIILDSVGSMSPEEEKNKDLEDNTMMVIPRLMSKFLRRNARPLKSSEVSFIFTNQVRAKVGSYVGGYEPPGGNALRHFSSVIIQLYKGQKIQEKVDKETFITGLLTRFVITKNKQAPPMRSFTIPLRFGEGIDELMDAIEFASYLGVIKKGGPYYKFEEMSEIGKENTMNYLREHPETLDKIREVCYNSVNSIQGEMDETEEEN